ncbi:MAG: N-acetyl-gamma-glutamyl-phosphate reductase [Oscillospiraceae bacterium]|jgi:N-acetyl-gamma-glutamyl-phosphate reductase|nr:N-acetyl-gamma-glutamyl-phosphate reductase [Oscillospiraceae bacterium]
MIQVFLDGQEGTTGLQIHARLRARQDVALLQIDPALRKDDGARRAMLARADVAILCLPDEAARQAVSWAAELPGLRVIDTSTAHRVAPGWAYGLPELSVGHRQAVAAAARIAVPGCHATGFLAAVYPLVAAGALASDAPLTCHSITGYSGGGKAMIAQYQAPDRPAAFDSPRQYALGQAHKHLPEMRVVAGLSRPPVFNPIVCDFYAGMAVSVPLHATLLQRPMGKAMLLALLRGHYAGQRFISVHPGPEEGMLSTGTLAGTNDLRVYVCGNDERLTLVSVLDNLGKGASGAAMQCMNIALGLPEDAGFHADPRL